MFRVKNMRSDRVKCFSEKEFKEFILKKTKGKYIDGNVTIERTNTRPEILSKYLYNDKDVSVFKNIFIVTAVFSVNKDPKTRYMILIDGIDDKYEDILEYINDNVPVYGVEFIGEETTSEVSYISTWFRQNMGSGYSFIDIDYFITNNNTEKIVIIEEKTNTRASFRYGQLLSYGELINDVVSNNPSLIFTYITGDNDIKSYQCNSRSLNRSNLSTSFVADYPQYYLRNENILEHITIEDYKSYILKMLN